MNDLKKQLSKLFDRKSKYKQKLREINAEAKQVKKIRDKENEKVKEYKKLRNEIVKEISEISKQLKSIQIVRDNGEESTYSKLKKEYDSLNWKYQTDVFSPSTEKRIVAKLDELEARMLASKELKENKKKLSKLYSKIKKLRQKASDYHELVVIHANESEKNHKQLINFYSRKDAIKEKIKELDDEINSIKSQLDELHEKEKSQSRKVKRELQEYAGRKKKEYEDKLKARALEALEKFKKGKKITIEEFALIEKFNL